MNDLQLAVANSLLGPAGASMALQDLRAKGLPYVNNKGQSVIQVHTGKYDDKGRALVREHVLKTNASLRHEEALQIDAQIIESYRQRAGALELFRANNLIFPVGNLGVLVSAWERASEMSNASVTLDGESLAENDTQDFQLEGVPIPIIQKPFKISERMLLASRRMGGGLDVTQGVEASIAVARAGEDMLLTGVPSIGKVDGYQIYGLTNHPNRNLGEIGDWADPTYAGTSILADLLTLMQTAEADRRYGPYALLIPKEYNFRFYEDFKANSDKTLMQRVLEDPRLKAVQVCDRMATGQVVIVQLDRSTIDIAIAADVTTIQWPSPSGWTNMFQVYMAGAPRIKTDYDGRSGIVHATVGS